MNGCQGAPWSEECDAKELHGAFSAEEDLKPRGSVFPAYSQQEPTQPFRAPTKFMWYCSSFIVGGILHDPLYCSQYYST